MECGSFSKYFGMNASTGEVTLAATYHVDSERPSTLICTAVVWDAGGLSANARLIIVLTDINNHSPKFPQERYTFAVSAETPLGASVGNLSVSDNDVNFYGSFNLTLTNQDVDYFAISDNGSLYVNRNLTDIGYQNVYSLIAKAVDFSGNTGTAIVTVLFYDVRCLHFSFL